MNPVPTNHCNHTFTAPAGMSSADVGDLPCRSQPGSTTSWWEPTDSERLTLAAGGLIEFTHYGHGHPVVSLSAVERIRQELPVPHLNAEIVKRIVGKILDWKLSTILPDTTLPDLKLLKDLSLEQMLSAVLIHRQGELLRRQREIESGATTRAINLTIDDSMVAACFIFLHSRLRDHDPSQETIIHDGKQALVIVKAQGPRIPDDDED